jgi:hypothetical protein
MKVCYTRRRGWTIAEGKRSSFLSAHCLSLHDAMVDQIQRRFTLRDLSLLVAVIAPGLAWNRIDWPEGEIDDSLDSSKPIILRVARMTAATQTVVFPYLCSASAAILCTALAPPGPSLRQLMIRPGMLAILMAVFVTILYVVLATLGTAVAWGQRRFWVGLQYNLTLGKPWSFYSVPGAVIAGAWLTLGLTGQWRAERSWNDRLGRCVAVAWLVMALAKSFVEVVT